MKFPIHQDPGSVDPLYVGEFAGYHIWLDQIDREGRPFMVVGHGLCNGCGPGMWLAGNRGKDGRHLHRFGCADEPRIDELLEHLARLKALI